VGKLLIIDCGVLFPEETQPGVDVILPDFTSIRDRLDDIVGVVLTRSPSLRPSSRSTTSNPGRYG
jgi:mRNA degradation ribonuclease J1/J2